MNRTKHGRAYGATRSIAISLEYGKVDLCVYFPACVFLNECEVRIHSSQEELDDIVVVDKAQSQLHSYIKYTPVKFSQDRNSA